MATVLGLLIHGWVPIGIIENDIASPCKVQSDTTASRRTYKAQYSRIVVEPLHQLLPHFSFGPTIQPHIIEFIHVHNLFENVQHFGHLSKNKDFLATLFDVLQQSDHLYELPTIIKKNVLFREVQLELGQDWVERGE
jgi:hypothetical protein